MSAEGAKRGERSSQADFLRLPYGRTGRLGVVGLRAQRVSWREAAEPKESPANHWALGMKRGIRVVPWDGSWRCISAPLPRHFLCSVLVIMSPGGPGRKIRLNSCLLG